jgi:hypothetical protein
LKIGRVGGQACRGENHYFHQPAREVIVNGKIIGATGDVAGEL